MAKKRCCQGYCCKSNQMGDRNILPQTPAARVGNRLTLAIAGSYLESVGTIFTENRSRQGRRYYLPESKNSRVFFALMQNLGSSCFPGLMLLRRPSTDSLALSDHFAGEGRLFGRTGSGPAGGEIPGGVALISSSKTPTTAIRNPRARGRVSRPGIFLFGLIQRDLRNPTGPKPSDG